MNNLSEYYQGLTKGEKSIQKHHVVPISLGGHDKEHNIAGIIKQAHRDIHIVLDIPIRMYSKKTRETRKITNHKILQDKEIIEKKYETQNIFFKKLPIYGKELKKIKLLKDLKDVKNYDDLHYSVNENHKETMKMHVKYREDVAEYMGIKIISTLNKLEFFDMFRYTKEIEIQIANEIKKTLETKYYKGK